MHLLKNSTLDFDKIKYTKRKLLIAAKRNEAVNNIFWLSMEKRIKISVIIPNWNGRKLLEKNLPAVLATGADEVIVIDNGSVDGSQEYLERLKDSKKDNKTKIKIIFNKKNLGFVKGINQGVGVAQNEVVVLLNNDVVPDKNFLFPLIEDFRDPKIFAVSLNEPQWSWAEARWEKGFIEHQPGPRTKNPHISFWASGGSGAFRRELWSKLGGFDILYFPFYWEDVDLSYRAWKRGYKIIWDPRSIVYHKHEGTIGKKFSKNYIDFVSQRNQLLFIWKNISSFSMLSYHRLMLAKKLFTKPGYWRPFLAALSKFPLIFPRRLKELREKKVSDKEIFNQFQ